MNNINAWIATYTNKQFYPLSPRIEDIDIIDMSHALSNLCRFTGHCRKFYSVAQHSVLVSQNCKPEHALYGLTHDLSEAYLTDFSSPIKRTEEFAFYRKVERNLQAMIYKKFGLECEEPADVKEADLRVLATESRDLMNATSMKWPGLPEPYEFTIEPMVPEQAKELFMARFRELTQ